MAEEEEHAVEDGHCELCDQRSEEMTAALKLLIDYVIPDFDPEDADIEELLVVARYCTADPDTVLTPEEARTALVELFVMDMWHWANEWLDYNAEMALIARDERARLEPRRTVVDVVDTL